MKDTAVYIEVMKVVRMYDDAEWLELRVYDDLSRGIVVLDDISKDINIDNAMDLLRLCKDPERVDNDVITDIIDDVFEDERDVVVNGEEFDWEDILEMSITPT